MPLSLPEFLCQMAASPALTLTVLLTLAVLLVNGWTDAPNAIAAAVVTGALPFRPAVGLAALCNLLGVLCVTAVNTSVAETIYSIASFGGGPRAALAAPLRRHGFHRSLGGSGLVVRHPHQREPRTGSRHLRGGRRPGGQLVLHPVGLLGPGGAGAAGLSGSGLLGGPPGPEGAQPTVLERPAVPQGPDPRGCPHRLPPWCPGRAEISGHPSTGHCPVPGPSGRADLPSSPFGSWPCAPVQWPWALGWAGGASSTPWAARWCVWVPGRGWPPIWAAAAVCCWPPCWAFR